MIGNYNLIISKKQQFQLTVKAAGLESGKRRQPKVFESYAILKINNECKLYNIVLCITWWADGYYSNEV